LFRERDIFRPRRHWLNKDLDVARRRLANSVDETEHLFQSTGDRLDTCRRIPFARLSRSPLAGARLA